MRKTIIMTAVWICLLSMSWFEGAAIIMSIAAMSIIAAPVLFVVLVVRKWRLAHEKED